MKRSIVQAMWRAPEDDLKGDAGARKYKSTMRRLCGPSGACQSRPSNWWPLAAGPVSNGLSAHPRLGSETPRESEQGRLPAGGSTTALSNGPVNGLGGSIWLFRAAMPKPTRSRQPCMSNTVEAGSRTHWQIVDAWRTRMPREMRCTGTRSDCWSVAAMENACPVACRRMQQ